MIYFINLYRDRTDLTMHDNRADAVAEILDYPGNDAAYIETVNRLAHPKSGGAYVNVLNLMPDVRELELERQSEIDHERQERNPGA